MTTKSLRALTVGALVIFCAALLSASALGKATVQPDLRVPTGSARVNTPKAAQPVLSGRFTVVNVGTATATHFRAWVELTATRHTVILQSYRGGPLARARSISRAPHVAIPKSLAKLHWAIEACVVVGVRASAQPGSHGCRKLGTYDLTPKSTVGSTSTTSSTPTTTKAPTTTTTATAPVTPAAPPGIATTSTPMSMTTVGATTTTPTTTTTPASPTPTQSATFPTNPVTGYAVNQPFFEADGLGQYEGTANPSNYSQYYGGDFTSGYWVDVPPSYDQSNETPDTLLVWMHECSGLSWYSLQQVTSDYSTDRPYIAISLSGPEAGNGSGPNCWDTEDQTDVQKVLTDISQVETELNINPRRVIIGGFSSGGNLAYQTIFTHADTFAGILAANTDPVMDNSFGGYNGSQSTVDSTTAINNAIASAGWRFNIAQLTHSSDNKFPPSTVTPHMNDLTNANPGFPVTYDIEAGNHDDQGSPSHCDDSTPGTTPMLATCTSGTYYDIAQYLLPTISADDWEAPTS